MSESKSEENNDDMAEDIISDIYGGGFKLRENQQLFDCGGQMGPGFFAYWPVPRDGTYEVVCPIPFKKVSGLDYMPSVIVIEDDKKIVGYVEDNKFKKLRKDYILKD